jgi:hypothetical protein
VSSNFRPLAWSGERLAAIAFGQPPELLSSPFAWL